MRPPLLLAVAGVALSVACSDKSSPTGPDAVSSSSAAQKASARSSRPSRPGPRVVGPRTPIGPSIGLLRIGNWGSLQSSGLDNRLLAVTRTGAVLRSECSNGAIDGPIRLDASGHFQVLGTFQIQAGPAGLPRPARFAGIAVGEKLTLTVTLTEEKQNFGPFTMTFGQTPQIGYCPIV